MRALQGDQSGTAPTQLADARINRVTDGVCYVDDFLGGSAFRAARALAEREHYQIMPQAPGASGGGNPDSTRFAHTVLWPELVRHRQLLTTMPGFRLYPVGDALDTPLLSIRNLGEQLGMIGVPGEDCAGISCGLFQRLLGSRLMPHNDLESYLCTFALFLHHQWKPGWGGLMTYPEASHSDPLVPLPNRLVIMKSGVSRAITPVEFEDTKGWLALYGYFMKTKAADKILHEYFALESLTAVKN